MGLKEKLKVANEEAAKVRQEKQRAFKGQFKQLVDDLFSEFPELQGIRWAQYAPYFNDGDPCIFSIDELHYTGKAKTGSCDDEEDEDGFLEIPWSGEKHNEMHGTLSALHEFMSNNEELIQEAFGDDCQVTIWRGEEPEVSEYEHD